MGKARAARILAEYGPNATNLNPHGNDIKQIQKQQNHQMLMNQARTKAFHRFKKVYKDFMKAERKKIVLKVFGYWKYWLLEGRIGPTDDDVQDQPKEIRVVKN